MAKLKIGDRVTIYRKIADIGGSAWVSPYMDYTVGLSGEIFDILDKDFAIILDNETSYWWFPKSAVKREVKNDK